MKSYIMLLLFLLGSILLNITLVQAAEKQEDNLYLQGMQAYEAKQYPQAFEAFQNFIRLDPTAKDALFMLGLMYEKGDGVEKSDYEASEMYRRAWKAGRADAYDKLNALYSTILEEPNQKPTGAGLANIDSNATRATNNEPAAKITRVFMKLPPDLFERYNINVPKGTPAGDSYEIMLTCDSCTDLEAQAEDIAAKLGATITYNDSAPVVGERVRSILSGNRTEQITIQRKSLSPSRGSDDSIPITINLSCGGWCKVIQKVAETVVAVIEVVSRSTGNEELSSADARALSKTLTQGKYYGLIIGINNYKHVNKLKNAVNDAIVVDQVLRERYGFETRLLIDEKATRDNIMKSLNDYRKQLTENDSLLIFYSGHGEFNKESETSYWLPIDADRDDNTKWLEARSISNQFKLISARHILIIADSCFSGTMTRTVDTNLSKNSTRENYLNKLFQKTSRVLIASGGNEPVTDAGGKGHSIFSDVLITALNNANENIFTAEELMTRYLKESVGGRTEQTPEYKAIQNSGHDSGDFIFKKNK
jgi:uncharacterized caspase-like protein